jgi:hypothetical protein
VTWRVRLLAAAPATALAFALLTGCGQHSPAASGSAVPAAGSTSPAPSASEPAHMQQLVANADSAAAVADSDAANDK